ncbi:glycosyltransferase family 4 protein [Zobellella sp. DQSA1]|uniref:glycosyltransferase family 4 protein n=1 Tax=Zobellella sp. DQSA1 TaxID=3342386 RepID=UPI0035C064DD
MAGHCDMTTNRYDVVVLCLSHFAGGMELDAVKMAEGFSKAGIRTLLVCRHGSFVAQQAQHAGVPHQEVEFRSKLSLKLIFQLRQILMQGDVRNLIFLGTSELKSIYFALVGMPQINLIVRYGTTMSTSKKDPLHRWFYSRVNYHLCISEHLKNNVRKIIPVSRKSGLGVIYTSSVFLPEPPVIAVKKAIHVGRIAAGKGQLDALLAVAGTGLPLKLVGSSDDDDYLARIKNEISARNMAKQVILTDFQQKPQQLFHDASIFLFPSHGEGLSNALIEALGNGLICIAYNNTVFPEFQRLGFHLHLARNQDIDHLRELVRKVMNNFSDEKYLASKNISLARKLFSREKEVKHMLAVLK